MIEKDAPKRTLRQHWDQDGHLWVGGVLAALWVLFQLDAPIVEDSLFLVDSKGTIGSRNGASTGLCPHHAFNHN